jgi:hypothetical protein
MNRSRHLLPLLFVGALPIAVLLSPVATADPDQDTTFLAQLERNGINSSDGGANAVRVAHGICPQLAAGNTPKQAWQWAIANTQLGLAQAVTFTHISMNVYCPQYLSEIGPGGISGTPGLG